MRIANKISFSFFSLAVIISSLSLSFFYAMARKDLKASIYANLELAADSRAEHIKTYLNLLKFSINQLSKSVVLEEYLKEEENKEKFVLAMERVRRTKDANPSIYEFLLTDRTGKVVVSNDVRNIGIDKSGDAFFIGGQKGPYIKDAYFSEDLKRPLITMSAPIFDEKTKVFLGVIAARINITDLDKITTDRAGLGKTGEVYIVNKYGYMITPSRFIKNTFLKQKVDTLNFSNCLLHVGDPSGMRERHVIICPNYRGTVVLGTHVYIPEMKWCVLAEIEEREVFAPLEQIKIFFVVMLLLVALTAYLVGLFIARTIAKPINRLHEGMEIVGKGNLDYKVGTESKDEVGQLSRAFDDMVEELKHSTASIDSLNKEISERQIIEDKLRTSEAWVSTTLKSIGDGVIATDTNGRVVFMNDIASGLTGYSIDDVAGRQLKEIFNIVNEVTGNPADNPIEKVLREGVAAGLANHTVLISKNGNRFPIDDSAAPIKDGKGKILGAVLVFRDVTERRRREEINQRLAAIVQSSDDAIIGSTLEGVIIDWNKGAERIYGYREEEIKGRHVSILAPKGRENESMGLIKKVANGEKIEHLESIRIKKDGRPVYLSLTISPIYDANGNMVGASAIGRDITERKEMENKLQDTAKEWEATFNSISDLVSIHDKNSKLLRVNKAYADFFKMKPEEVVGQYCYSVVHGADEPCLDCPHQNTVKSKKASRLEYFEKRFNLYLEVSTSPILDKNNEVVGTVHIIKDISERKRIEQKLKEAAELKSHFTSMVSHELRTPLTAIKESISIVADGTAGGLNEEQKDFLDMSKKNVDRLARLINDVLDYQKLESGKLEFHMQDNDMNEIIRETAAAMLAVAKEKGLEIILNLDDNLPLLKCDRDKIIQVLSNLISNAIKFTESGGITIISEKKENVVELKVKDTGVGIKNEDLSRLFRAFEQLAQGKERKTGSTGLGLAISKEIIDKHRGKIWAESEFGKGTIFHVILPIVERRI